MFRTLTCLFAFLALCPAQAPQTGSVAGQVLSLTGEPLRKATLRLQGQFVPPAGATGAGAVISAAQLPPVYSVESDASGNFIFEAVPAGRYTLYAERNGYVRQNYSTGTGPAGANVLSTINVSAGQSVTGIAMKMTPQALIAGKVTDEDGDPFPNTRVTVGRWNYAGGRKQLVPAGSATSGPDGTFIIGNLAAGRYYLSVVDQAAMVNAGRRALPGKPGAPEEAYVTTYYPSVTDLTAATALEITAGAEMRGLDVRMRKARVFHISGKLIDATTGAAPPNANVSLVQKDSSDLNLFRPNSVVRGGEFEFNHLLPGSYILQVNPFSVRTADGTTTTTALVARQVVNLGNDNIDNLVLQAGPGAEVTGKITTEGSAAQQPGQQAPAPAALARPRVILNVMEGLNSSANAESKDDGTFVLHNLAPATYRVNVVPVPPGTYVKSIRFGGLDITKTTLDLTSGSGGTLDVVLSANAADVTGTLHGQDGQPVQGASVTIWSPDMPDFNRTNLTDQNGTFRFFSLAPGTYHVAAWEQIDPGMASIPEFRSKFDSQAGTVKLSENSHETVEAPLIRRDAIEVEAAKLR